MTQDDSKMTFEEVKKYMGDKQGIYEKYFKPYSSGTCPNCGYCEHCGRSNRPMQPMWRGPTVYC